MNVPTANKKSSQLSRLNTTPQYVQEHVRNNILKVSLIEVVFLFFIFNLQENLDHR